MSLSINNKTIKSLMKDNKEIVKIERVADGKILYELNASHSYALSVTASNDIIQSGSTTTLTATLTDNGNPTVGKSIVFKKGSTVLDTVTTDSNGEAEYEYTGTGAGDVTITVLYGSLLQETFVIEDCLFYDPLTSNSGHYTSTVSGATARINEYSENGWKIGYGTTYHHYVCDYVPQFPYEVSFEIKDKGSSYDNAMFIANGSLVNFMSGNDSIQIRTSSYSTHYVSVIGKWTVKVYSNKFEVYRNDVYVGERTHSNPTPSIEIECGGQSGRYIQIKDLKVKALHSYDLSVTASDDIIQSGDTTTLTATLTDNGNPVIGESIVFKNGSTVLDTVTTDNMGEAEYQYTGTGAGDVTITVLYGSLLQETYEVQDCQVYDTNSYNISPNSGIVQIGNISYPNTGDWEIEWIHNMPSAKSRTVIYPSTDTTKFLGVGVAHNGVEKVYDNNEEYTYSSFQYNTDYTIKIKKEANTLYIYSNGNLLRTSSNTNILNSQNINLGVRNWGTGTGTVRNIKVKAL